ncbi:MAG: diadenylate cyclase CdaA [Clostridiales bacterium]|nr:diadenylate cyclase CdaA [Clostridiales bacterium]
MVDFIQKLNIINVGNTGEMISLVLDCLIVSYIVYKIITIVRETRAWQLLKGVIIIFVAAKVTRILGLKVTSDILNSAISYIALAFVVLFQPELRRTLEKIGNSKWGDFFNISTKNEDILLKKKLMIEEIVQAVSNLSKSSTGAIIIYERETKLGEIINTGTKLDACVSSDLLENIFIPNTPLHDGAVVIRDTRIIAAACILILTNSKEIGKRLGTRHRAAMGITEISDCLAITVSEETAEISFYMNGKMYHAISTEALKEYLSKVLLEGELNYVEDKYSIIHSFRGVRRGK